MKRGLILSDFHVGSIYGLWPQGFKLKEEGEWKLNPAQSALLAAWKDMIQLVGKVDFVVINGDSIDGLQCRSLGIPTVTTNFAEQSKAALTLLEPIRELTSELFLVRGTEYHDSTSGHIIEGLGRELKCNQFRKNQYSSPVWNIQIDGVCLNFVHWISTMSGLYRATAPDREGVWAALAGRHKVPDANLVCRSHLHNFVHVEHSTKHIIITPCWQVHTEYQIRKGYYRYFPEIGAVVIEIKKEDKDPIRIKKFLWGTPREGVYKI